MSSRDDFIMLVESIYRDAPEGVVWVCSNDRNSKTKAKWRQKPLVYPSDLRDAGGWLNEEASSRREVYFAAHAMLPGPKRTKAYALPVSTLWADGDGALVPDHLPQPSVVIESSPGRHWYFWCLDRPIDPAKAEELGRRIAATIGADPSGADVTQVARVPGTRNYKYPDAPEVVLLELQADRVYSPAEIESAFNQLPEQRRHVPHDPNPVVDTSTAPPVSLSENDLAVWTGAAFVTKPDGSVDRSRSLCAIARMVWDAGADAGDVLSAIRERDKALGWHKYTSRSDGVERYNEIVGLVVRDEDRLWDRGCALIATLRSAEDGGALIQQIVDDPAEAAALRLIADRNPSRWTGCLYALEERREKGARIRALKTAVKNAPAATRPAIASTALPVSSVLGSASPAPDGMVVPAGWTLSGTGIGELGSPRALTVSPILLTGRWVEEGGTEHIEVAWLRDGRWVRERVARGVIADRRQLVALADRGFPVTTENSGALAGCCTIDGSTPMSGSKRFPKTEPGAIGGDQSGLWPPPG